MTTDRERPNVLFILVDDLGYWGMGCAGNSEIRTPNLDRIAAQGIRFERFFCTSPVCSPARASILTGRIPSQHGIHDWLRAGNSTVEPDREGYLVEYLRGQIGYTDVLAAHGYVCGISGKWHMGDSHHAQKGFSYWEVHAKGGGPYYGAPMVHDGEVYEEPRYVTDAITENALRFLEGQGGGRAPWCLNVHYTAPHSPWDRANHPRELYDAYYDACPFDSVPREPMHPWQVNSAPYGYDEQSRRALLSGYYAATTAMDAGVGRIVDWLEARGARENTLLVFMSDNGMNMGHHGIYGKGNGTFPQNMYDTSVKVPALISWPRHAPRGIVCGEMLSQYDWLPTLLDCLGYEVPEAERLPGRSFAPLLRGEPLPRREAVVVLDERGAGEHAVLDEYGPVRMIRTREWKYVHRYPYGPHELYDLLNDPEERVNLVDDGARQGVVRDLKAGLEAWFVRYVDPALDGTHEGVTGKGQLGLAGPAGKGRRAWAGDWHYLGDRPKNPGL
ncbi:MAG: sulfatase-like hydrolase/transferase [Anaerolineae bacterium]|nr:sulfatase-like hydrolase/transferase [Anaerolineae bacterium]